MNYKSIVVTQRGGLEAVQIMENELRPPAAEEARIRVLATPVCQDDIAIRKGNRPFLAKIPFTPGYACIGTVEAVGENVVDVAVGDRVAALTNYDSHAEVLYWDAQELVHVPESIDPAEGVTLILNYLVAYQILHRVAQVKAGDKVLIIGASGGVGTAFLQLGRLAGVKMFGLASASKHAILIEYGATPIDYRTQDFVEVIRQAEPEGLDFVFNGMGEEYYERGLAVLRRGGVLVHYGAPQSFSHFLLLVAKLLFYNLLPNGKKIAGYGTHRLGTDLFKEDWTALFELLQAGQIQPIIQKAFPLLEATKAYALLESGAVTGNLVLLAPGVS
ncbi:MAG: medium chain dehydrogenase/reductase family protein [Candidatus Promineifilaceae bacterium]|jgi:NADPH:quinone reductase-like Zn-dependent oxidoreductase